MVLICKSSYMLVKKYVLISIMLLAFSFDAISQNADWTILVFLNADNDLEMAGIEDFTEMAQVPKSDKINILVQMDRSPKYTDVFGNWSETLRFKITPGMEPTKSNAISNLGELNMGDPNVLKDFIFWGKSNYPAKNYFLVIWDHGDGWRFRATSKVSDEMVMTYKTDLKEELNAEINLKEEQRIDEFEKIMMVANDVKNSEIAFINQIKSESIYKGEPLVTLNMNIDSTASLEKTYNKLIENNFYYKTNLPTNLYASYESIKDDFEVLLAANYGLVDLDSEIKYNYESLNELSDNELVSLIYTEDVSPVKAVSNDGTDNDLLYNKEIEDVLENKDLDIVGFDACLMSMTEISYALFDSVDFIVGSEELEPGSGWRYDFWLGDLVKSPEMTPRQLSANIVKNYEKAYLNSNNVTLSALDSSYMSNLADVLNQLALNLIQNMPTEHKNIQKARALCRKYAIYFPSIHSIDLSLFAQHLKKITKNDTIKSISDQIIQLIDVIVVENFYSSNRGYSSTLPSHGSFGLAIYFPKRKIHFDSAYTDGNTNFPVSFVKQLNWDNFLQEYYRYKP